MRMLVPVTAAVALLANSALAADLRTKAPIYKAPPPVVQSWNGFYVGANAGHGWADSTDVTFAGNNTVGNFLVNPTPIFPGGTLLAPASIRSQGALGGLQFGYNWQFSQLWLVGFETDFNWAGIKGTGLSSNLLAPAVPLFQTVTADQHLSWFGTVRARAGILANPNFLIYGTGGFAYGRLTENVNESFTAPGFAAGSPITVTGAIDNSSLRCVLGSTCLNGGSARIATGWTAGGGGEVMVLPNVTVKAEYLYVNLTGDSFAAVAPATVAGFPIPASFTASYNRLSLHTVRLGINYKFGGPLVTAH